MTSRLMAIALMSAAAISVLAADAAHAGTLTIYDTGRRSGSFSGGEFGVSGFDDALYLPVGDDPNNVDSYDFHTFCLEKNESINLPGTYDYTLGTAAVLGGSGATNGSDPLAVATAKLYFTFWTNQWSLAASYGNSVAINYDYDADAGGKASSKALQEAIWYLEGEISSVSGMAANMVAYAQDTTLNWSDLGEGWSDSTIGLVRVINLTKDGANMQSQLVVVPLPAAALMGFGLLGSMGLVTLLRRRRSSNIA